MKTKEEIDQARDVLVKELMNPDLSYGQKALLSGMSVALQWVRNQGGRTLQRLLNGEEIQTPNRN